MPATMTVAAEMIDFAAEMGDRFPDKPDAVVLADIEEAFEMEYDDILTEDRALSAVLLVAYATKDVEHAMKYARDFWRIRV